MELEYSVEYQSFIINSKTDITDACILNESQIISEVQCIKTKLNKKKDEIDSYQVNLTKEELKNKYGTTDLRVILKDKSVSKSFKDLIKKSIFYDKLTDKIYMMTFKYQLTSNFKLKNVSNAGLKMTEIINQEKIIDNKANRLVHFGNAEMPGNFIVAVNYYIKSNKLNMNYDWYGNSLLPGVMGPKSEGLPDYYGFYKKYKDRWIMNEDKMNGDITDMNNIEYIENYFNNNKCDLYTSDAGVSLDIHDFNHQEFIEIKLKLAEVLCGLITLKAGGNMVIKIYTFFEKATIDVIIILSKLFKVLKIVKPMTSKPTNSENYIIGIDYIGYDKSLKIINLFKEKIKNFNECGYLSNIHKDDINVFNTYLNTLYNRQIEFIDRNIYYFNKFYTGYIDYHVLDDIHEKYIRKLVEYYYDKFVHENKLKPIDWNDNL